MRRSFPWLDSHGGFPSAPRRFLQMTVLLVLMVPATPAWFGARATASPMPTGGSGDTPRDITNDTLVARFGLPEGALEGVTTSVELVAALREHLTIDLAMPLDEPLTVILRGRAGRLDGDGPPYHFVLGDLAVGYRGEALLDDFPYALAVRESYGDYFPADDDEWEEFPSDDWDEDEAWADLVEALDVGLPQSSREFAEPGAGGHVGLQVRGVHVREFSMVGSKSGWDEFGACCDDEFPGALFQLEPYVRFQSAMTAGMDADADMPYRLNRIVIELEPAEGMAVVESGVAIAPDASGAAEAEALEVAALLQGWCYDYFWDGDLSASPSAGEVVFGGETHPAHASFATEEDGERILRLTGGSEEHPFCLVLMGVGQPTEPGTYEVLLPSEDRIWDNPDPGVRAMFGSLGIGPEAETLFVAESGHVVFDTVEPSLSGRFELRGWTAPDGQGGADMTVSGSFDAAVPGDGLAARGTAPAQPSSAPAPEPSSSVPSARSR